MSLLPAGKLKKKTGVVIIHAHGQGPERAGLSLLSLEPRYVRTLEKQRIAGDDQRTA